ncbi:MAG TPA: hypothetical protein DCS11_05830 [Syntrophus sp. (in: bacteria)]|nr:hypothetical protein [Syntrophus sp. (in: bacteria)]
MALAEMYDYLPTVSPDADYTLGLTPYAIHPQGVVVEEGRKNQVIHVADDNSEERISFSDDAILRVRFTWETLTAAESGTIVDFYYNPLIGNALQRSFKWKHPDDGHTYVVRWDCDLARARKAYDVYGILEVVLRVLGRIADA